MCVFTSQMFTCFTTVTSAGARAIRVSAWGGLKGESKGYLMEGLLIEVWAGLREPTRHSRSLDSSWARPLGLGRSRGRSKVTEPKRAGVMGRARPAGAAWGWRCSYFSLVGPGQVRRNPQTCLLRPPGSCLVLWLAETNLMPGVKGVDAAECQLLSWGTIERTDCTWKSRQRTSALRLSVAWPDAVSQVPFCLISGCSLWAHHWAGSRLNKHLASVCEGHWGLYSTSWKWQTEAESMVSNAYGKSWSSFLRSVVIATLRNHKSLRLIFLKCGRSQDWRGDSRTCPDRAQRTSAWWSHQGAANLGFCSPQTSPDNVH